jgi:hypothetical protein
VDDFSKYTWLYPLQLKSNVCATFLCFKQLVETYFDTKIILVQSDNGGEFRPLQTSLTAMGVSYRLSCPHTQHQMGSVERKHHHIVETILTLATATIPFTYWDSAFETATYFINWLPSKVTKQKSPFEYLFKLSLDYKFLKFCGCECWPFLHPYNSTKLAFRSQSCVFIGYSKNHLKYKCLHIPSGRIYIARHVIFNEQNFPFSKSVPNRSSTPLIHTSMHVPLVAPSNNQTNDNISLSLEPYPTTFTPSPSIATNTDTSDNHALVRIDSPLVSHPPQQTKSAWHDHPITESDFQANKIYRWPNPIFTSSSTHDTTPRTGN